MTNLDARVAALMEWVREYRFAGRSELAVVGVQVENAIRAELQKPALHEPYLPCCLSWGGFNLYGDAKSIAKAKSMLHDSDTVVPALRDAITELQGRAKPKQKEPQRSRASEPTLFSRALDRASKGEKT